MKYGVANVLPASNERFIKLRREIFETPCRWGASGFECFMKEPLSKITGKNLGFNQPQ
jgi:hypothetical protein